MADAGLPVDTSRVRGLERKLCRASGGFVRPGERFPVPGQLGRTVPTTW